MHSKAAAALQRLKEMDRKYNVKWNEGKRVQSAVSTESSLEESPRKARTFHIKDGPVPTGAAEREKTKVSPKARVEVKIPMNQGKGDESSISDIITLKESPKTKLSPEIMKTIKVEEEKVRSKESSKSVSTVESNKARSKDSRESSVSTALSEKSNTSEVIKSAEELSTGRSDGKSNAAEVATEADSTLNTDNNDGTTIEEAVKTVTEKSESVSEISDGMEKEVLSLKEEPRNRYDDDTFEEASSSSESVNSVAERLKKPSEEDTVVTGIKQIKITPHKQVESPQKISVNEDKWLTHESPKDKEIVELIPPKVMQSTSECDIGLDEELSNYVKRTENADDTVPIALLKLSKQLPSARRHARKGKRHRKSSNENIEAKTESSPVPSEHENLTERNEATADAPEKEESPVEKNDEESCSPRPEKEKNKSDEEVAGSGAETETRGEPRTISSEEKFLRETPIKSDVTSTLRKLNKDAINAIVRRQKVHGSGNRHRHCRNCGTVVIVPTADKSRNEVDDSDSSAENAKTFKDTSHDQRVRDKRGKGRKSVRASKKKSSHYSKVESKHSRFDCRQTHRLRKHAAAIRLQQEREDIRNYLLELERTRLEYGPGESATANPITAFRPLEFPKIAAFARPDEEEANSKPKDEATWLRERILMIKQWLKDQYILYRDYSNLAQTINSKYIPASLEDAKRTIRQLQRATVETR